MPQSILADHCLSLTQESPHTTQENTRTSQAPQLLHLKRCFCNDPPCRRVLKLASIV